MKIKNVLIYAGSRKGNQPIYTQEVKKLAQELAKHKVKIIFGAGSIGLMGDLADEYLRLGGEVKGIIPEFMEPWEVHHRGMQECVWTKSMHERKELMATEADAIIALPGGLGTLDELFEILTWKQLKLHQLPIAIFNIENFYQFLLAHRDTMVREGFVQEQDAEILVESDPKRLVERLMAQEIDKKNKYNHNELI